MEIAPPPVGLGTLLRALLSQLEPAVEDTYRVAMPSMRSRFYPILRALVMGREANIGDLAIQVGVSQPAMTQTVREMVAEGLLSVTPGSDRRSRLVSLSEFGLDAVRRLGPAWRIVGEAARGLEADTQLPLHRALERALAELKAKPFHERIEDLQSLRS